MAGYLSNQVSAPSGLTQVQNYKGAQVWGWKEELIVLALQALYTPTSMSQVSVIMSQIYNLSYNELRESITTWNESWMSVSHIRENLYLFISYNKSMSPYNMVEIGLLPHTAAEMQQTRATQCPEKWYFEYWGVGMQWVVVCYPILNVAQATNCQQWHGLEMIYGVR